MVFLVVALIVVVVVAVVLFAILCLPAILAFKVSYALKSKDWIEVKWALGITMYAGLLLGIISTTYYTHHNGSSDGDFFGLRSVGYAMRNYSVTFAWVWGGDLACAAVSLPVALILRLIRHKRSHAVAQESEK